MGSPNPEWGLTNWGYENQLLSGMILHHQPIDFSPKELRLRGLRRDSLTFHVAMASARWRRAAELLTEMRWQMRLEVVSYTLAGAGDDDWLMVWLPFVKKSM